MTTTKPEAMTTDEVKQDGQSRVARTVGQVTIPGALVTVGQWVAQQVGWHGQLPPDVVASLIVLLTAVAAVLTNKARLAGRA